jgi:mono/diheme cytochrome c family protein
MKVTNSKEDFKTEDQKQKDEILRKIILQHCVICHQQLDLLQLRLINFDDLIKGVIDTLKQTQNLIKQQEVKKDKPKLKKV